MVAIAIFLTTYIFVQGNYHMTVDLSLEEILYNLITIS